ncbi:MAG: Trk system potassium transport protein TrkA, partial [Planktomarina sp.]|nr:Trk system potassium transport protein TrkA [Planktomarina sp.]
RDIEFPEGVLVGAVRKGNETLRPSGSVRLEEGDHIVIFALADDVREVERLLQVTVDFF